MNEPKQEHDVLNWQWYGTLLSIREYGVAYG